MPIIDNNRRTIGIVGGKQAQFTQVQSNWNETDNTSAAYIQNKPTNLSDFTNDEGYITQDEVLNYKAFPADWHTTGTMSDIIADIAADDDATTGMSYMSTVSYSDLPASLVQGEVQVDIMADVEGLGKTVLFTLTSSNTAPYHWEYTSAYGQAGTWRAIGGTSVTVTDGNPTLSWNTQSTVGTVNGTDLHVTMPAQPTFTQAQADWNQSDSEADDYIKNKPTIMTEWYGTQEEFDALQSYDENVNYHIESELADVALSGDYTDLINKPTIPAAQVNADWNASSGVAEILNKPTIPTVPSNIVVGSANSYTVWTGTQAQYDALSPNYSSTTLYFITAS